MRYESDPELRDTEQIPLLELAVSGSLSVRSGRTSPTLGSTRLPNRPAVDTFTNCESIDGQITATGDVGSTTTIQPVIVVPALGTPA